MIQFARFSAMRRPSHEIRWTKAAEERRESFLAWARSPYEYRVRQMCVCTSHGSVENPLIFSAEAGDVAAQGVGCIKCNLMLCVPVFLVSARVLSGASTETRKRGTRFFFAAASSVRGDQGTRPLQNLRVCGRGNSLP